MCTETTFLHSGDPRRWIIIVLGAMAFVANSFYPGAIQAQPVIEVPLYSFGSVLNDGLVPSAGLVIGPDSALYGVTSAAGISNCGTIFKISRDGSGYQIIHQFTNNPDGAGSKPALMVGGDGLLYGTTSLGGTNNAGTIFRISPNGGLYQVVYHFKTNLFSALNPVSRLLQAGDGLLYGTSAGGTNNLGAIFRVNPDGSSFQVLRSFTGQPDGSGSLYGLIQASDGFLYGTTTTGGISNSGTLYKLGTDGGTYQVVHNFTNNPDGASPRSLMQARDGTFSGVTSQGGNKAVGTIFQANPDGSGYLILHSFTNNPDGAVPFGGLVQGWDDAIYGTTYLGGTNNQGSIYRFYPGGANYSELHAFDNGIGNPPHHDGSNPGGALVAGVASDNSGVFYGTTSNGSTTGSGNEGTIFGLIVNPGLTITPLNNQNVVMWPAWALNFQLQMTTNPSSGIWLPMTNGVPLAGVQLTNVPANAFFRLVWPQ